MAYPVSMSSHIARHAKASEGEREGQAHLRAPEHEAAPGHQGLPPDEFAGGQVGAGSEGTGWRSDFKCTPTAPVTPSSPVDCVFTGCGVFFVAKMSLKFKEFERRRKKSDIIDLETIKQTNGWWSAPKLWCKFS